MSYMNQCSRMKYLINHLLKSSLSVFCVILFFALDARKVVAERSADAVMIIQSGIDTNLGVYKLYPTQNTWIFIKLNSRNGKMWLVQFATKEQDRFETFLNIVPLVSKDMERNGRFVLLPTQNFFTFILLDQVDGKTWQVQWSTKPEERLVMPIN